MIENKLPTEASVEEVVSIEDEVDAFLRTRRFAGVGMSLLPEEIEADIRELDTDQAVELHNRLSPGGKRLCGVSDSALVAQRLGKLHIAPNKIKKEIEMIKSSEIKTAPTGELVKAYNELSGKSIKKFSSRAAGEKQVAKLLDSSTEEGTEMPTKASKTKANGKPKKTNGKPKRERAAATTKVQLTVGNGQGRLNATSMRTKIVEYMKQNYGQKAVEIDELSKAMKIEARPYVTKLAMFGWVKMT